MVWGTLARIVTAVTGLWLIALLVFIVLGLFRGKILVRGLLSSRHGGNLSVGRIQLMIATIAFSVGYFGAALAKAPGQSLPDIPMAMLAALIGSHGVYLGGKYNLSRRKHNALRR